MDVAVLLTTNRTTKPIAGQMALPIGEQPKSQENTGLTRLSQ
jgi:hypothetical protein